MKYKGDIEDWLTAIKSEIPSEPQAQMDINSSSPALRENIENFMATCFTSKYEHVQIRLGIEVSTVNVKAILEDNHYVEYYGKTGYFDPQITAIKIILRK